MNQPLGPILPDLPNTEPFQELRFHLQELHWDLKALVKEIEALSPTIPDNSQAFRTIRYGLIHLTAGIEHDASHHLAMALKLTGEGLAKPYLSDLGEQLGSQEMDWDRDPAVSRADGYPDDPLTLHRGIEQLASVLRRASQEADRSAWGSLEDLENGLKELAEILGSRAWSMVEALYPPAYRLHRAADPVQAAEDDYWQLIATPLHEDYHPLARSLDSCPRCGAPLTEEDCTFDGSYCESCRSRWFDGELAE